MAELNISKFDDRDDEETYQFHADEEKVIACCNQQLVHIVSQHVDDKKKSVIQAMCPRCECWSYKFKVDGFVYVKAAEHMDLIDVQMTWRELDDGIMEYYYKCEVKPNGKARE